MTRPALAEQIIDRLDHDPPERADPHPDLFSDLSPEERLHGAVFELWQHGIVDAEWDDEAQETEWWLTHFGAELNERGLTRAYIEALEYEIDLGAEAPTLIDLTEREDLQA